MDRVQNSTIVSTRIIPPDLTIFFHKYPARYTTMSAAISKSTIALPQSLKKTSVFAQIGAKIIAAKMHSAPRTISTQKFLVFEVLKSFFIH